MKLSPLTKSHFLFFLLFALVFSSCRKDFQKNTESTTNRSAGDGNLDLLGYGYDTRGLFADARSAKGKVLDVDRILSSEPNRVQIGNLDFQTTNIVAGKDFSSHSHEISNKVKITAGFSFFKAEITSNSTKIYTDTTSTSFATGNLIINRKRVTLDATSSQLRNYLTTSFIDDCNRLSAEELVNTYGTAVLRDIFLGGKLHFAYASRISSSTQQQMVGRGLNASVDKILKIKLSVSGDYSESISDAEHQEFSNEFLSYETIGGDASQALIGVVNLGNATNPSINVTPWANSVTRQNAQLIDFGSDPLIPIYELIPNAQKRNEVKNYILTNLYQLTEGSGFFLEGKLYFLAGNAEWEFNHVVMGYPDRPRLLVPCLGQNDDFVTLIENAINVNNPIFKNYVPMSYFWGIPRVLNTPIYPYSVEQDRIKDQFDENDKYALTRASAVTYPTQEQIVKQTDLINFNGTYYLRMHVRRYNPNNNATTYENYTVFPFKDENTMLYYNVEKTKAITVNSISGYQIGSDI